MIPTAKIVTSTLPISSLSGDTTPVLPASRIESSIKALEIVNAMPILTKNPMVNVMHAFKSVSHALPLITVLSVFRIWEES